MNCEKKQSLHLKSEVKKEDQLHSMNDFTPLKRYSDINMDFVFPSIFVVVYFSGLKRQNHHENELNSSLLVEDQTQAP